MHDDKIQGILFTQSAVVDLVERTPSEKLARTMLAKRHALQRWGERQHLLLRQAIRTEDNDYAVRGKKHYYSDMAALQSRLKSRD